MLDARNNRVFTAFIAKQTIDLKNCFRRRIKIEEWINHAVNFNEDILVLGDGFNIHMKATGNFRHKID